MGHRRSHLTDFDVRFWVVPPYVVVYREQDPLQIVRVFHERQNIERHINRALQMSDILKVRE